ncbi:predicted protein [Histoplasma mississippiense (nom. inval.)]|uniref:predicted protein n=1 Tax=Ajellomyces capsulatus (strain NAm1 / WU24) TaxID=2059318 RepID=UPI000157C621|nr:predicted protein [Histoplasma mississippiense (nom. inval.)]EDN08323.1 predicted protein [Histoplasma mississippiense (nom. inval.)]
MSKNGPSPRCGIVRFYHRSVSRWINTLEISDATVCAYGLLLVALSEIRVSTVWRIDHPAAMKPSVSLNTSMQVLVLGYLPYLDPSPLTAGASPAGFFVCTPLPHLHFHGEQGSLFYNLSYPGTVARYRSPMP